MLHFGEIEVGPGTARDEFFGIMEEVEREVKYRCRHGRVIDCNTGFIKVPSSGTRSKDESIDRIQVVSFCAPYDKDRRFLYKLVGLPIGLKVNLPPDSISQVDLSIEHVCKCG